MYETEGASHAVERLCEYHAQIRGRIVLHGIGCGEITLPGSKASQTGPVRQSHMSELGDEEMICRFLDQANGDCSE